MMMHGLANFKFCALFSRHTHRKKQQT